MSGDFHFFTSLQEFPCTITSLQFSYPLMSKFALLYLWSDSTTVPLADENFGSPRDAFKKGFQKHIFVELIEKR